MWRHVLATVLYVAFGATLAVMTTWASALAVGDIVHGPSSTSYKNPVREWSAVDVTRGPTYEVVVLIPNGATRIKRFGVPLYPRRAWWTEECLTTSGWAVAHGFPSLCLYSWRTSLHGSTPDKSRVTQERVMHWGLVPFASSRYLSGMPPMTIPGVLSFRPIWTGLVIDTLFWGLVLFVFLRGLRVVRRALRQRRSRCPACAYPIGTSPVCTECGKAVSSRRSATT